MLHRLFCVVLPLVFLACSSAPDAAAPPVVATDPQACDGGAPVPTPSDAGPDAYDYWAKELEYSASGIQRPRTGAGLGGSDGKCGHPDWLPTPNNGCEYPCGHLFTPDEDGGADAALVPKFPISDNQLCINTCPPPFTLHDGHHDVGVMYVPFHCYARHVDCDCLPPDVCGRGTCMAVEENQVLCTCPADP